ncbi:MAG TPA: hypothetical protein VFU88_20940 [Ktedonobacterales bacterium]|nr:hypothetical protein [Ktedonobacterales bacterium]
MGICGEDASVLAQRLAHVLWIGGAPDAGKTSLAQELVWRHGLQLYHQDRLEPAHFARATVERHPEMRAFWTMSPDERWVLRPPEEMAAQVVRSSAERFEMAVEDLLALPSDPPILAEGPWLFPQLVAPVLTTSQQGLWLVPTLEFKRASAARRDKPGSRHETSDPERATRNWLARDLLLADHVRAAAAALGLTLWEVDGSRSPDELAALAEQHFASWVSFPAQ